MVSAGAITVAVRVRPPTAWESARLPEPFCDTGLRADGALSAPAPRTIPSSCLREVVKVIDDRVLVFDPEETDRAKAFAERGFVPPGTKRYKDKRFMFDKVFGCDSQQVDVYEATAKPLLDGLLDGYNATIFAYGATGCGKTHTISGTEGDPGIIYLTMVDLFQKIEEKRSECNIDIYVTFLEIYNEEIRDLLAESGATVPRGGLQIREDKAVKVVGLVELQPTSVEQIKEIVLLGNSRRTQSPTHANETSSRSHAALQIHVTQSPRTASTTEQRTMATLSIIDLAGSERAAATTNMGQRMVEGANINKSLLALGNCINALCESGGATRHVPYRNSKLTRLLKFSLGGNCKTVMVVCISAISNHFDDTHNTLLYADRASKIKTKVVTRNVVNVDRHVGQYVEAINRLNNEVKELKAKLAGKFAEETQAMRRRQEAAKVEIERAMGDMDRKAEQTKDTIVSGAICEERLNISRLKLQAFNEHLARLKAQACSDNLMDLTTERSVLESLISSEEAIQHSTSNLRSQVARSRNAENLFDALLRAVTERRSDKLDEAGVDFIKLNTLYRKSQMEHLKTETHRNILQDMYAAQAGLIAGSVGALTRSSRLLEEGSKLLRSILHERPEDVAKEVHELCDSSQHQATTNKEIIESVLEGPYNQGLEKGPNLPATGTTSDDTNLQSRTGGHDKSIPARRRTSTRLSTGGLSTLRSSTLRRSPKKSLRSSLVNAGPRTKRSVSDGLITKKKGVQWKDQVGQGSLDDGDHTVMSLEICNSSLWRGDSDWEGDRTDESSASPFSRIPLRNLPPNKMWSQRPSRLGSSFLKSKSSISSLQVVDEEYETTEGNEESMRYDNVASKHVDKRSKTSESPVEVHSASFTSDTLSDDTMEVVESDAKAGLRSSNIGPLRSGKFRRRPSSKRLQLQDDDEPSMSGPRRVPLPRTPAKRPKRFSLLGGRTPSSTSGTLQRLSLITQENADQGSKSIRPTWR